MSIYLIWNMALTAIDALSLEASSLSEGMWGGVAVRL